MKCFFFQLCAMTQVKMAKPSGLPRASIFIQQSNGRHRGRAQGGGGAQTWSDASCIILTLAHCTVAFAFAFHSLWVFSSSFLSFFLSCFVLVCVWSEAWVGWLMGGWGFLINSPGTASCLLLAALAFCLLQMFQDS